MVDAVPGSGGRSTWEYCRVILKLPALMATRTGWQWSNRIETRSITGWNRIRQYISPRGDIISIILDEQGILGSNSSKQYVLPIPIFSSRPVQPWHETEKPQSKNQAIQPPGYQNVAIVRPFCKMKLHEHFSRVVWVGGYVVEKKASLCPRMLEAVEQQERGYRCSCLKQRHQATFPPPQPPHRHPVCLEAPSRFLDREFVYRAAAVSSVHRSTENTGVLPSYTPSS